MSPSERCTSYDILTFMLQNPHSYLWRLGLPMGTSDRYGWRYFSDTHMECIDCEAIVEATPAAAMLHHTNSIELPHGQKVSPCELRMRAGHKDTPEDKQ